MDTKQGRRNLLSMLAIGIGFFAGKTIAKAFDAFSNSKSKNVSTSVRIHPNAVSRNTKGQK
jgi:hypothetical protein